MDCDNKRKTEKDRETLFEKAHICQSIFEQHLQSYLETCDYVWVENIHVCPITAHCCLFGSFCRSDIRRLILWSERNLGLKPGMMGAHCLHPLVAGCNSTTSPFVCLRVFMCAQCVFVRLCVNLESVEERASSGESTILYVCVERPPSISCIS